MGQMQIWQRDGIGTDEKTLDAVVTEFRKNGVQGIQSQYSLNDYLKRLDDERIRIMCRIDMDATLQMMTDCMGAMKTFIILQRIDGDKTIKLRNELDNLQDEFFRMKREKEQLIEEIKKKDFEIVRLKAKLYDTYEANHRPTASEFERGTNKEWRMKEKTQSV